MWTIEWDDNARKELRKLDYTVQEQILSYLEKRIATEEDPRRFGEGLSADKVGLWRYRIGNYRVVCQIEDQKLVVLVVRVGHRRNVYDN
ncbi:MULTISPECIES: type II toxin-antitoxin system RelE family toxin [Nostocales]|uniref:Translation repressor RelE n=2 Tax=Nostocales TaxID=1161 RepID=A0A0C1QYP0_9CYAN|nr:type II toxin-antitoxin system RelE/ParE family toxin [Tolypothrix bouteillei]KAF3886623.1 type II toxin-antitoxin system RelE/ParE family toxin [Tolypothrix bouteillei VB521301]